MSVTYKLYAADHGDRATYIIEVDGVLAGHIMLADKGEKRTIFNFLPNSTLPEGLTPDTLLNHACDFFGARPPAK